MAATPQFPFGRVPTWLTELYPNQDFSHVHNRQKKGEKAGIGGSKGKRREKKGGKERTGERKGKRKTKDTNRTKQK